MLVLWHNFEPGRLLDVVRVPRVEVIRHQRVEDEPGRLPDQVPASGGGTVRVVHHFRLSPDETRMEDALCLGLGWYRERSLKVAFYCESIKYVDGSFIICIHSGFGKKQCFRHCFVFSLRVNMIAELSDA